MVPFYIVKIDPERRLAGTKTANSSGLGPIIEARFKADS